MNCAVLCERLIRCVCVCVAVCVCVSVRDELCCVV